MEELTAGLLGTGMVMIAGGSGAQGVSVSGGVIDNQQQDGEFSSPSPSYSSGSSISSSCSPAYYASNILPSELFTEFEQFSAFELNGTTQGDTNSAAFLQSSDEDRNYMEELISSDLSSDEDKFLETIRYGGGGVVHFSNDLLSEEELVNTIQNYGDVKVVQVDGGEVQEQHQVFEVVNEGVAEVKKEVRSNGSGGSAAGKKRKGSVGNNSSKGVKRTLIIQQQQTPSTPPPKKHLHKQSPQPRVFEDEIIIESDMITADLLDSPSSPGSPQPQQQDANGTYQELKLSDEEKRLLSKEGISLPTHYPLTKLEERELKRIRRKIRNKISAQDSRKRKKEFLDRLQQKLQEVEDEKSLLSKRVRSLESINSKLTAQVKRLQQALTNATSTTPPQQKQTVVPAATTLLVLILSLALVVLPTSMDQRVTGSENNANEIISLLNRSNELAQGNSGSRVLTDKKLTHPKSRTMVGQGDDDMDEDDMMDVRELIGQMKTLLRNKRKRNEVVGMVKRGRFDTGGIRGGGGGGLAGLLGVMRKNVDDDHRDGEGWWVSDEEEDVPKLGGGGGGAGVVAGRFKETRTHAFQIVDDVEVD